MTTADCSWLTSTNGFLAACSEIAAGRVVSAIDEIDRSPMWSRLVDASPHPLGAMFVERGRLMLAATRVACADGAGDANERPFGATSADGSRWADDAMRADLVRWLASGRPPPVALRRVTFLVDEHAHGRALRLTLAQFPGARSFAPDVFANPFTIVDDAFAGALDNAREPAGTCSTASDGRRRGRRARRPPSWRAARSAWQPLVCFDRLQHGLPLGAETSWAFTGAVDGRGPVIGCAVGSARALTNKLRAAERRNVVVAGEDLVSRRRRSPTPPASAAVCTPANDLRGGTRPPRRPEPVLAHGGRHAAGRPSVELATLDARRRTGQRGAVSSSRASPANRDRQEPARTRVRRPRIQPRVWQVAWGTCFEAEATAAYRPAVAVIRSLLACSTTPTGHRRQPGRHGGPPSRN